LKAAAVRAKLGDDPRVEYIEREPGRLQRTLGMFAGAVAAVLGPQFDVRLLSAGVPPAIAREVQHELGWLAELTEGRKPFAAVTHCLCSPP